MKTSIRRNTAYALAVAFILAPSYRGLAHGEPPKAEPSIRQLSDEYNKAADANARRAVLKRFQSMKAQSPDDVVQLRAIFADKKWNEDLFAVGSGVLARIDKPELAGQLILILNDEKEFIGKLNQNDLSGKTEREAKYRFVNVERAIQKLGDLKSKEAVPVLKEYIALKNMQYAASEALGKIGDKSMSEQIREKAYQGEEINYGGMGVDEAQKVVQDLEDKGKKDKWPKIAKQIVLIKNPAVKPYLKKLFSHEQNYVRREAAMTFSNLVDESNKNDILDMTRNQDWAVRDSGISAIKRLKGESFQDTLIDLLSHDPQENVRASAAKALGYKKLVQAVPYLEKALKDKELWVRQEAFISLYVLTGKKYDVVGKNALLERRAELEKKQPSFH